MSIATQANGAKIEETTSAPATIAELIAERDRLRAELAQTQTERDSYLKTVYYYLRKEAPIPTFTKEEVFAHIDDKPTFEDVVAEITKSLEEPV
jgi:hypothetical protein